jgi:roadblock/LC7 domain-containing protein
MKNRIEGAEILTRALLDDFSKIKDVLLPSEYHPDNGLVNQFAKQQKQLSIIEAKIQKTNTDILKMKTTVATAISVVGGIIVVLEVLIKFIK